MTRTSWDARATRDLIQSYHQRGLLDDGQVAELDMLVEEGTPEIALAQLELLREE